jgi:hypothetical protein
MKKFFAAAVLVVAATSAYAAPYGAAGCGLGSMIFEKDNTWWKQVLAATTNGTSGNQTFGISTGTLNCDSPAAGKTAQVEAYIEANKLALANDIAKGNGETISGLSKVYGCGDTAAFGMALKSNYRTIFPSANVATSAVATQINGVATNTCGVQL